MAHLNTDIPARPIPGADPSGPLAWSELDRLAALVRYAIQDTEPEACFDEIVGHAVGICDAPMAAINLFADDRQWFKAKFGFGRRELPLDTSICRHAILNFDMFVVPDLARDPRFASNPLVVPPDGLRFYAGAVLKTDEGLPLGMLCVLDTKTRPQGLSECQASLLRAFARQVMLEMNLKLALAERQAEMKRAEMREAQLKLGVEVARLGLGMIDYLDDTITLDSRAAELFGDRKSVV